MTRLIVSIAIVFLVVAVLIGRLFTPRQRVRRLLRRVQDPNRGQSATKVLRAMGDKALPWLDQSLAGSVPETSAAAAEAILNLGTPASASLLARALGRPGAPGEAVVRVLEKAGGASLGVLTEAMRQGDSGQRSAAVSVLGRIGGLEAASRLAAALIFPDVGSKAADALVALGPPAVPLLGEALGGSSAHAAALAVQALARIDGAANAPRVLAALTHEQAEVRTAAASALPLCLGHEALAPLIQTLEDSKPMVWIAAAAALGGLGDPAAIEPLSRKLRGPLQTRAAVLAAIEEIGGVSAIQCLAADAGREDVAATLDRIGGPQAVAAVVKASKAGGAGAGLVLGRKGDPRAVPGLLAALKEPRLAVRKSAAELLSKLYRSGSLDDAAMRRILQHSVLIRERHTDSHGEHNDCRVTWAPSDCSNLSYGDHIDESNHADHGIGMPFEK
jgi:HEAT repeat protein